MSLVASFLDMSGAVAIKVLEEASQNQELPRETKDMLQCCADLEWSKGHAVLHLLSLSSTLDANMKLLRRHEILSALELQPCLLQAAYLSTPIQPVWQLAVRGGAHRSHGSKR